MWDVKDPDPGLPILEAFHLLPNLAYSCLCFFEAVVKCFRILMFFFFFRLEFYFCNFHGVNGKSL